ncbi:hypothetical protein PUNSTDRAFT_130959 [Punctularia strigosozonata HHB-11173 SS5]|uniref:uncharacterized protein n=1 Tax=Punctularia strigosozonata (strain HHB-11173) TaxID=741275 RepID=UPI0004417E88|nr:uncharacterized protein PUNSTDRAFT_130959 [Punctularia strigosozonata HHB-11173 SS5]EIN12711.1 hypothetical protein PUNSTDRAFT_130959 [Punctularia strigosozonata HHB-11173 SS5]
MPRNHNTGASTLRNRNRITNKTRLRILEGSIDADPLVLEEDEEKARVVSTAGVDAEDANEHHLQAVLSAASKRHQAFGGHTIRSATDKAEAPVKEAYIPVPDSTGVADNYEELYPPGRWTDPSSYVRTSETVEEGIDSALVDDFTYFMDERDKEWLDKNNEEARGEGTSVQGALASGTTTRSGSSQRSAKAKGKEPDVPQPVPITEDEFELVMGVFEKVTHEKTEFLHHSLQTGMAFPAFTEYQETFSTELRPAMFASFTVPTWAPRHPRLLSIATAVYPHWRERRLEREGRRIIPVLNFDEQDVKNESYICFRRREVKQTRKTRAQQISFSDKLFRLQEEMGSAFDLANHILVRENQKRDLARHGQALWDMRAAFVDLKRKFPTLGTKDDDELLVDKERPPKRPKQTDTARIRFRAQAADSGSPATPHEIQMRPKERYGQIMNFIESALARQKERDSSWEDGIDNPYQRVPVTVSQRAFKWFPVPEYDPASNQPPSTRRHIALRARMGRGGRQHIDRRLHLRPSLRPGASFLSQPQRDVDRDNADEEERTWRMRERWMNDGDDYPGIGSEGPDEQDRTLVDDYQHSHLLYSMTLLYDQDHNTLSTDATIPITLPDGRQHAATPFKLGPQPPIMRGGVIQRPPPTLPASLSSHVATIQAQNPMKRLPPAALAHTRISSNGGMRPPAATNSLGNVATSPPASNGVIAAEINPRTAGSPAKPSAMLDVEELSVNGSNPASRSASPVRPKSTSQHLGVANVNGFNMPVANGYPITTNNGNAYIPQTNGPSGLSPQQVQGLKSAFAMPVSQDLAMRSGFPAQGIATATSNASVTHGPLNLKLPQSRQMQQMQWLAGNHRQPSGELNGTNGLPSRSPTLSHAVANGVISHAPAGGLRSTPTMAHVMAAGQGRASPGNSHASMSPHMQNASPVPVIASYSSPQSSSPPRPPSQAPLALSPSMQHQLASPLPQQHMVAQGVQGTGY